MIGAIAEGHAGQTGAAAQIEKMLERTDAEQTYLFAQYQRHAVTELVD